MPGQAPPLVCRVFQVPKEGSRLDECEDVFAMDLERCRFAVADGASESFASADWARLLVQGFVNQDEPWPSWLTRARSDWLTPFQGRALSWFAETKLNEGASATLLGLEVHSEGTWQAESVGDTCLFQIREDRIVQAFPMLRSKDFGNQPALLCSQPPPYHESLPLCLVGEWRVGDVIYLATDAIALWFLAGNERNRRPWRELRDLKNDAYFADWVKGRRRAQALRNDDMTLICLEFV